MPKSNQKIGQISEDEVIFLFEEMVKKWRNSSKHKDDHSHLGRKLFEAVARLSASVAYEAVAIRRNKITGKLDVFMQKRKRHQTYAGQWHCPGSIFRPYEKPADVLKRLERNEFKAELKSDNLCVKDFFIDSEIGWLLSRVYIVQIVGKPSGGKWWPVNALPKNTVSEHRRLIIPAAVKYFKD